MPYELLDAIERAAIRDKQSPLEVYNLMRAEFPQYDARQLLVWVERFFRLWCRNQWKRERYAPSLSPRRRKPRSQDLVPVPDPIGRVRAGAGRIAAICGKRRSQLTKRGHLSDNDCVPVIQIGDLS